MLFGRSAERAHLEQLLDAVASGTVGCILEGTAGIGKTTLWRESVESHLSHVYREYRVSSRSQLVAALATRSPAGEGIGVG